MSFYDEVKEIKWDRIQEQIAMRTPEDVHRALGTGMTDSGAADIDRFISLVSPAADEFIEEIAQQAQLITEQRFGRIVGLYAPMYLSNSCTNACVYCSFNVTNDLERETLSVEEAVSEARHLHDQGFRHILLVSCVLIIL